MNNSQRIYEKYSKVSPGGVQSNYRYEPPHPTYFKRAKGSRLWDVDGKEFCDYLIGYGSIVLGHADPRVKRAVIEALEAGMSSGIESELDFKLVDTLCRMIPSAEMARVCNSGTEAVMHALMIARGYTGKDKIAKAEGGYHGWYDPVLVSYHPEFAKAGPEKNPLPIPASSGLDRAALGSSVIFPYNDSASARRIIKEHRDEIAAVMIEPICFNTGALMPKEGFLEDLREITSELGIPLIFDEVITGFRIAPGGAQQYFNIEPDLSIFGKAMANGFPISAITGRADLINVSKPGGKVAYAGTYNGNQISAAASHATLGVLKDGSLQKELGRNTEYLRKSIAELAEGRKYGVHFQGVGGKFQIFFSDRVISNYRETAAVNAERYAAFRKAMMDSGILFHQHALFHHGITGAHTKKDLAYFIEKFGEFLDQLDRSA
jgi:glutamate-1-semialdehyde 2,1-aminomutase